MTAPRLALANMRKGFGDLDVLSSISMTVHAGEFVSILGPSGAGKSTIFKLLTGGLTPDGPRMDTNSPRFTRSEMPPRTSRPSKLLRMSLNSSRIPLMAGDRRRATTTA